MHLNQLSTIVQQQRLRQIENIPCSIIWSTKDNLISVEYATKFTQMLKNAEFEKIGEAGHSPFVKKTAKVYERISAFLIK
jgi:pimeloyl-ACP methyl ester carboxylesterase